MFTKTGRLKKRRSSIREVVATAKKEKDATRRFEEMQTADGGARIPPIKKQKIQQFL